MSTPVVNQAITPPIEGGDVLAPANLQRANDALVSAKWYSADQVAERVRINQEIYRRVMKENEHFGKIPGCDKPSLWKAGSEQLLMTFRLAVRPKVQDLSTPDCARIRVYCEITHAPTGTYLGTGIGECSSDETKYKWRKASAAEWGHTPEDRRRTIYKEGNRGEYAVYQVRAEVADVANTVLKMAKKRAQIDGTLTVTAASDIFTQDIEDFPEMAESEGEGNEYDQRQPETQRQPVAMPQRKAQPQQPLQPRSSQAEQPRQTPPAERTQPAQQRPAAEPQRTSASQYPGVEQRVARNFQRQPESPRPAQVRTISEGQSKRFFAIAMGNGITKDEMRQYVRETFGVESDRDIPADRYDEAIAWAQGEAF